MSVNLSSWSPRRARRTADTKQS